MFCQTCGKAIEDAASFCTHCGIAVATSPLVGAVSADAQRLRTQLRTMGILWAVYSAFRILMSVWTLVFSRLFLHIMSGFLRAADTNVAPLLPIMGFLQGLYVVSFMYGTVAGIAGAVVAWGLLQSKPWGRVLALVIACVSLISIPFGTAMGVYTLIVLIPSAAAKDYDRLVTAM